MTVNSSNSQTTRSKNVVNKAETYSFKGIVKRKTKIVTFVPAVKTVEAKDVVKGSPTTTSECAINIVNTKSKNKNGKIN